MHCRAVFQNAVKKKFDRRYRNQQNICRVDLAQTATQKYFGLFAVGQKF